LTRRPTEGVGLKAELLRPAAMQRRQPGAKWRESHVALGALHEGQSRPDDARLLYSALVELWKDGDSDLILLETARGRLKKLSPGAGVSK
jgi:hypothetical protein